MWNGGRWICRSWSLYQSNTTKSRNYLRWCNCITILAHCKRKKWVVGLGGIWWEEIGWNSVSYWLHVINTMHKRKSRLPEEQQNKSVIVMLYADKCMINWKFTGFNKSKNSGIFPVVQRSDNHSTRSILLQMNQFSHQTWLNRSQSNKFLMLRPNRRVIPWSLTECDHRWYVDQMNSNVAGLLGMRLQFTKLVSGANILRWIESCTLSWVELNSMVEFILADC